MTTITRRQPLRVTPSTPGLADVSGISDEAAPTATGKMFCAFLTGAFRSLPSRLANALPALLALPPNARVYEEKAGSSDHYFHRIRFRAQHPLTGKSHVYGLYLGVLADDQLKWVKAILDERRRAPVCPLPTLRPLDMERIAALNRVMRLAHTAAREIAPRAGFSFRGYRLMRRRNA